MKRLLILAYDFPPYVSVGGLRPYAWYRYLKEYGVEPIVVTRQWGNKYGNELDYIAPSENKETIVEETEYGTIIRTPYKPNLANKIRLKYGKNKFALVRKMVTAFYEFTQFFFFVGPKSGLYRGAKEYLKTNKVDAIIATGEPFVLFKYASTLSKIHNVPWIADYRDPWTQNKDRSKTNFKKKWNEYFEKKYIGNVFYCTTVSDYVKNQISKGFAGNINYRLLPNGYNPEYIKEIENECQNSDCFSIAFAGTIDKWHPIDSVFSKLESFVLNNPNANVKLDFYGINIPKTIEILLKEKYSVLQSVVHIYPKMHNLMLLKKLSHYNALLLFNDFYIIGTKIYDWVALRRKIIFCYKNDSKMNNDRILYYPIIDDKWINDHVQEDLITETNSGIIVENEDKLASIFKNLYNEFCQNGKIECNSVGVERFSRKEGSKQLADIIHRL